MQRFFFQGKKQIIRIIHSLNGIWKFKWSPDPQSRPADFYTENYSTDNWDNIVVPGNWEIQGFGTPIYTNINYPFKRDQPKVTSEPPKILQHIKTEIRLAAIVQLFPFLKTGITSWYF